jgi:predicted dehydrogenase
VSASVIERLGRRLRLGMVGGGSDSIIGETHRIAFRVDGLFELVAGALSIDPDIARASARAELIAPERSYPDYREMAEVESRREDGIDAVVIATPPQTHVEIALEFLDRGIHIVCEKPMAHDLESGERLAAALREGSAPSFLLTHCYTGYPMVREARALVRSGALGPLRLIEAEFAGGDPGVAREPEDASRRHWRFRADSMGKAAILGEVGSHAHNIVEYVTGSRVARVAAQMDTIASRREVFDNAYLNVEFDDGSVGRLWSSYVAVGSEHGLSFRIFGDEGSIAWRQEEPEVLWHRKLGGPVVALTRAMAGLDPASLSSVRFRPGHPEGYALAFANLYRDFAELISGAPAENSPALPDASDGLSTLRLIAAAERSQAREGVWEPLTGLGADRLH